MTMLNACPEAHAFTTLMLWKGGILGVLNGFYIFFDLSSLFFFNLPQLSPSLLDSPNLFFVPKMADGVSKGCATWLFDARNNFR